MNTATFCTAADEPGPFPQVDAGEPLRAAGELETGGRGLEDVGATVRVEDPIRIAEKVGE